MKQSDFVKIESILNREDDQLPFGYYNPQSDGKLTWNCGYDAQNKICAVFCYSGDGGQDKKASYLENEAQAKYMRDELINNGWKKLDPPKIVIKYDDGSEKPLSRKQKRYLAKTVNNMQKKNPFKEGEKDDNDKKGE